MTYDILATGSSGNAVVINGEILIDCGVPYKTLEQSGYIKDLRLVLLTHQHSDHFKPSTVRRLHQERPALRWGCCEWMVPLLTKDRQASDPAVDKRVIDVFVPGNEYRYGRVCFIPVAIFHDAPNCAWRFFDGKEHLFYATDTGTLDGIVANGYDLYLIEANHTEAEISARIAEKLSRGEFAYETRAAQNHLSQEQALEWLARNAGPNSRVVFLHQHQKRRNEE